MFTTNAHDGFFNVDYLSHNDVTDQTTSTDHDAVVLAHFGPDLLQRLVAARRLLLGRQVAAGDALRVAGELQRRSHRR